MLTPFLLVGGPDDFRRNDQFGKQVERYGVGGLNFVPPAKNRYGTNQTRHVFTSFEVV
jgi:hypothetical protein